MDIFEKPKVPIAPIRPKSILFDNVGPLPSNLATLGQLGKPPTLVLQRPQFPPRINQLNHVPSSLLTNHHLPARAEVAPSLRNQQLPVLAELAQKNEKKQVRKPKFEMGPDKGSTTPTIINNADGMFHSTKIINNAPFPQIVIIKQRQGKSNGDRPNNTQRQQLRALGIHRDKLLEALMENPQRQQEMLKQISDVFDAPRGQKAILKELDTLLREEKMLDTPREEKMLDTPRKTKELNNPRKEKELEERIEQLENAVNHQQAVLKNIESVSDPMFTRTRLRELGDAAKTQSNLIKNIEEALNDINIETSNTSARLNVLESIAIKQKKVLNDLLGGPANHVLDTETNQSANQQIQVQSTQNSGKGGRRKGKKIRNEGMAAPEHKQEIEEDRAASRWLPQQTIRSHEEDLEGRRQRALQDIAEVGRMVAAKEKMENQWQRSPVQLRLLTEAVESSERIVEEDGLDLSLSPSSRSLEWWRRLGTNHSALKHRYRQ